MIRSIVKSKVTPVVRSIIGAGGGVTFDHFVANFNTALTGGTGSAAMNLVLPFPASYEVHWGDGTIDNLNSHTYASDDIYTVEIFTPVTDFRFNNTGDCLKLVDMVSLGIDFEINNTGTWSGCRNMVYSTTDTPIINTTNLTSTFQACEVINGGDLSNWDMSSVTSMVNMFFGAFLFTGSGIESWQVGSCINFSQCFFATHALTAPIGVWNTSSGTNFSGMFRSNNGFNQDIDAWDISSGQQLNHMFAGANSFEQDLNSWEPTSATTTHAMFGTSYNGNITSWVFTSTISDMSWMFAGNNTFNQDISGWNVASVTSMANMFSSCSAFDQDLTGWLIPNVTNLTTMLDNCGMSTANYDLFLVNLNSQAGSLTVGLTLGAQSLTYTTAGAGGTARTALLGAPALMSFVGDSGV